MVIKWKTKNTTLSEQFGTIRKLNMKIVERGKIDTPNTQIHDRSTSCLRADTSIKSVGVKLVLWVQTPPPRKIRCISVHLMFK